MMKYIHALITTALLLSSAPAWSQTIALTHDVTNGRQQLADISGAGSLTPFGAGISGCCDMAGALATLADDEVVFIAEDAGLNTQTLHRLDASSGNQVGSSVVLSTSERYLALAWDNTNSRLLALARPNGGATLGLRSINSTTGAASSIGAAINNCCGVAVGVDLLDASNNVWYVVMRLSTESSWRLFTISTSTGAVIAQPVMSQPPVALLLDGSQVLAVYHDNGLEVMARVNTSTGALSNLGGGRSNCCFAAAGVLSSDGSVSLLVAKASPSDPFGFFSINQGTGGFSSLANVASDRVVNALFDLSAVGGPQIQQGSQATVNIDEDATPVAFSLTLNATDPVGGGLTWSISQAANRGAAGVSPGSGLSQTITYTPNADVNGVDSFVVQVRDSALDTDTIRVIVNISPVNDAPSFTIGSNVSINEDAGAQTINNWATNISPGPADEAGQTLSFQVSTTNSALFSVAPALSSNGTLTFTPAANANGTANLSVQLIDNGGAANGGDNTSKVLNAQIIVNAVNDAPSFTAGANVGIAEDSATKTISGWATNISAGPANESGQTLQFVLVPSTPSFFSSGPTLNAATGDLSFTLAADVNGATTVSVTLMDNGGTANGGVDVSASHTLGILVFSVNDPPTFTLAGNQTVGDLAGPQTVTNFVTNVSPGPSNESSQNVTMAVTNVTNASLFTTAPSINAAGTLTFEPNPGNLGTSQVQVTATDDGGTANSGVNNSVQTFNIIVQNLPVADLRVTITVDDTSPSMNQAVQYTIQLSNLGPTDAVGVSVENTLPADLINGSWNCSASGGSACGAFSGVGGVMDIADVLVNGRVTYVLTVTVDAPDGTLISNTATVTPPATLVDNVPGNNTATQNVNVGVFMSTFEDENSID